MKEMPPPGEEYAVFTVVIPTSPKHRMIWFEGDVDSGHTKLRWIHVQLMLFDNAEDYSG